MRKIAKRFNEIWADAEKRNEKEGPVNGFDPESGARFQKIYEQRKRYVTMGIYDSLTKQYAIFDTINLVGNYRYDPQVVPPEIDEMARIVSQ